MNHKIISFIFVISLAYGIAVPTQVKDVLFDVNDVINQVTPSHFQPSNLLNLSLPTGEFLIDTSVIFIPALNIQWLPSGAFDGTNYLVVWADKRSDPGHQRIYGARVNQFGGILDKASIAISTPTDWQQSPSVAFDGTNYLVVWEDRRNGSNENDIYGARVNQSGVVLDTVGIAISTAPHNQWFPSITFDGINYLVVWADNRNGGFDSDIYGTRVTQSGITLDTSGIVISTAVEEQSYPSVAFDDTNFLVVWVDCRSGLNSDIYGTRVNQSGFVLDSAGIAISIADYNQSTPAIAFNGTNYMVVWHDNRHSGLDYDIYGARVDKSGEILDTSGIAISTAPNDQWSPSIVLDGTYYLVIWEDFRNGNDRDIYGSRVSQNGTVFDSTGIAISTAAGYQYNPSVFFDGTNFLVVWSDGRYDENDIYGARVSQSGSILDPLGFVISKAANYQFEPSVAFDGTNYLVVWQDQNGGDYLDIYGSRVDQNGRVLDSANITITPSAIWYGPPSITFDGTNYLVVWGDFRNGNNSDIYGARINQFGMVLDLTGIPISSISETQKNPAVAFSDTNYFVVWGDFRNGSFSDIYGARVNQSGVVLDTLGLTISTVAEDQRHPSIAFDGTNYLVAWQDGRNSTYDIYGARVNQSGIVLDPSGIPISIAFNEQWSPSVAFDGTNYLVVWHENIGGLNSDIYGVRISQSGLVIDPNSIPISIAPDDQRYPEVAFDGINYVVVWQDRRRGTYFDICGAKVSSSGIVIDSFVTSIQPEDQSSPTLSRGQENQILINYSGWTNEYQSRMYNSTRIWGKFYPFEGKEEENSKVKIQSAKLLEVYPNPAKGVMRIRGPFSEKTIKIFDICGKMIREIASTASQSRNDGAVEISLKGINPGIYFFKLGKETKKFLVVE